MLKLIYKLEEKFKDTNNIEVRMEMAENTCEEKNPPETIPKEAVVLKTSVSHGTLPATATPKGTVPGGTVPEESSHCKDVWEANVSNSLISPNLSDLWDMVDEDNELMSSFLDSDIDMTPVCSTTEDFTTLCCKENLSISDDSEVPDACTEIILGTSGTSPCVSVPLEAIEESKPSKPQSGSSKPAFKMMRLPPKPQRTCLACTPIRPKKKRGRKSKAKRLTPLRTRKLQPKKILQQTTFQPILMKPLPPMTKEVSVMDDDRRRCVNNKRECERRGRINHALRALRERLPDLQK